MIELHFIMKKLIAFAALSALFLQTQAQTISGRVTSKTDGEPLPGATIVVQSTKAGVQSGTNGEFEIQLEKGKTYQLTASFVGFEPLTKEVIANENAIVNFALAEASELLEPVNISAVRAGKNVPIAKSNLSKTQIEERNEGRDMPFVLKDLPSTVVSSDAGTGIGYTGIRIRGSDISRINVTVNGIALNDPESHGVFWVNTPDLASSAQSIQVQRGVGTSTNGAGAFGASVNIKTSELSLKPYASADVTGGSFNTLKTNVRAGSGLLNDHWSIDARFSKINSDGFIDRATADLKSYYLSASYYSKKTSVQLIHFGGGEETYQAWWGVPEAKLNGDSAALYTHIINNGYDSQDSANLVNSNPRTYNYYTYDNETDNYKQDHYQLHVSHAFSEKLTANAALHYTWGRGYYEQYRKDDDLAHYGLDDVILGGDTVTSTDLIRRRWLNNNLIGTTYSLQADLNQLQLTFGGAYNKYIGDHYGEIIWAQYASNGDIRDRYYDNRTTKTDFNNYLKASYTVGKFTAYGDLQLRSVSYVANGIDEDGTTIDVDRSFTFFNPKAGVNYALNDQSRVYASVAVAHREPVRTDFLDAPVDLQPKAEELIDYEAGYELQTERAFFNANLFFMDYTNQLVLTGQLNDVGSPIRTNAPESYRAGIELVGSYIVNKYLQLGANFTFSQNKILNFTDYVVDYDNGGYQEENFKSTDISYSPNVIGGINITVKPIAGATIDWNTKYVGQQFMDNTSSESKSLDAFNVTDLRLGYNLPVKWVDRLNVHLLIANLFDQEYEPNGYTYSYIYGEKITENFYFPMAGINFMAGLSVDF
ncbi:outer membrane receptor protein [Owenweeksia hongkongensis DSM 17368]|uniref:Outer membrane receptor protein n=2 Tax=Owenweeksia TaxID=267986 RepID=G8R0T3_OWEHD|nr:outer membrane receptor protein [Owenweeksia hongkongensis DSM 17368]